MQGVQSKGPMGAGQAGAADDAPRDEDRVEAGASVRLRKPLKDDKEHSDPGMGPRRQAEGPPAPMAHQGARRPEGKAAQVQQVPNGPENGGLRDARLVPPGWFEWGVDKALQAVSHPLFRNAVLVSSACVGALVQADSWESFLRDCGPLAAREDEAGNIFYVPATPLDAWRSNGEGRSSTASLLKELRALDYNAELARAKAFPEGLVIGAFFGKATLDFLGLALQALRNRYPLVVEGGITCTLKGYVFKTTPVIRFDRGNAVVTLMLPMRELDDQPLRACHRDRAVLEGVARPVGSDADHLYFELAFPRSHPGIEIVTSDPAVKEELARRQALSERS